MFDFYPRFGFERVTEYTFEAELRLVPSPVRAPCVDLEAAAQRCAWLAACERAQPVTERFGATGYGHIALWHACNFYPHAVRALPIPGVYAVAVQQDDVLQLLDLACDHAVDLPQIIRHLIDAPISTVRFGFSPER